MSTQVAELHQSKTVNEEYHEHQEIVSSQTSTEWQKIATKEKKHVEYAQSSHFSKVT